ncbi:hypothetical protein SOVF_121470 [Spinacia oleracea]|nr:hypothetical protein SOVF_121470 [Spinacia oleracea]
MSTLNATNQVVQSHATNLMVPQKQHHNSHDAFNPPDASTLNSPILYIRRIEKQYLHLGSFSSLRFYQQPFLPISLGIRQKEK